MSSASVGVMLETMVVSVTAMKNKIITTCSCCGVKMEFKIDCDLCFKCLCEYSDMMFGG